MTKIIECYDVQLWDGGDRHYHECYVVDKDDAKAIAGQHGAVYKRTFIIHESKEEYEFLKSGELKKQALAKLTVEERNALGLGE
jgi:hypothetical protein